MGGAAFFTTEKGRILRIEGRIFEFSINSKQLTHHSNFISYV
jgi:hypothetical protein